ncbi:MAG: hydrogenase maturation protease [Planctomycetes bacterium]|nr:hydrogenase maturation protease [Planctomycetota bacterium]
MKWNVGINGQTSAAKPVVVLGLGNPLMADEGVGVCLVVRLSRLAAEHPDVEFLDAGTGGLAILHHIRDRRKAIFIDCAYMGQEPGAIRRFTPEEVCSRKVLAHQSLHEADLLRILDMSRQLGQAPDEVVIFGIQPERIAPATDLSPSLEGRLDEYLTTLLKELKP